MPEPTPWQPLTAYTTGNRVVDSHGTFQQCLSGGTSGATVPAWATTVGGNTTDAGVLWELIGYSTTRLVRPSTPGPYVENLVDAIAVSTGSADAGKVILTNAAGQLDSSMGGGGGGGGSAFNDLTTGTNTSAIMTVGSGAILQPTGSGVINATEINGTPITGTPTLGQIPIGQGDGSAAFADPFVQGVYPPGTNVTTGGIAAGPIQPVLVGAQNPSSLLENLHVDSSGNLLIAGSLTLSGSISVSNFPATQPVSNAGTFAVQVSNFPGTQPVSGTVAVTQSTSPWVVDGSVTVSNFPSSQAVTNTGTFAVQASGTVAVSSVGGTVTVTGTVTASNPSVGATGSAVPADATAMGWKDGSGNLQNVSAANPLPITIENASLPVTQSGTWTVDIAAAQTIAVTNAGTFATQSSITTLGQQLAAASVPVVLTAAQLTTLTPLTSISVSNFPSSQAVTNAGTFAVQATGTVAVSNFPGTQPVSGTVAATQSGTWTVGISASQTIAVTNTGTFATQDSNIAGTISAGKVAVTDAAAEASLAIVAGAISGGFSQDNISEFGGTAVSLGSKVSASSMPVVIASDQVPISVASNPTIPVAVQKTNAVSTGSVASLAKAYTSNVQVGTVLIICAGVGNATQPTIADSLGNVYFLCVHEPQGTAFQANIWYAFSKTAGANTVTVTNAGTAASMAIQIYEIAGLSGAPGMFISAVAATGTASPTFGSGSLGFCQPGAFAIGCVAVGTAAQTITVATTTTPLWTNDSGQLNPVTPAGLFSFATGSTNIGENIVSNAFTGSLAANELVAACAALFQPANNWPIASVQGAIPTGAVATVAPVIGGMANISTNVAQVFKSTIGGNSLLVANNNGSSATDGIAALTQDVAGAGANGVSATAVSYYTSATSGATVLARTPTVFTGALTAGGITNFWSPAATKRARLMRYLIETGEDATLSIAGPLTVALCPQFLTTTNAATNSGVWPTFAHRLQIQATALTTNAKLTDADWIDLGNGYFAPTASLPWQVALSIPQPASAVTPSFTIATNQWEAVALGLKTTGNLGAHRLRQFGGNVSSTATVATTANSFGIGNFVIAFVRSLNAAGGAPTFTLTDTLGTAYSQSVVATNASDGTHGSSLVAIYGKISSVATASNVLTCVGTVNVPTQMEILYAEYTGVTAIGTAAGVGATGSSTSPSSGAYTPGEVGNLVVTAMATAAVLASQPTPPTNFRSVAQHFTTQGSLAFADNVGNASLTAGAINIVCCGTEE